MADIFEENYRCYDYRRLHAMLRGNNRVISEKVVRRLMAEEQLVVKRTRRRRYNSYCGEIGPAPENLLARDFSSCRPNEKWLTDITEFQLPAGKVYLSPVIDCFDGLVVSWSMKWFTEFGHLNRGDMLTSEQHRCHNEKKKFQRRV